MHAGLRVPCCMHTLFLGVLERADGWSGTDGAAGCMRLWVGATLLLGVGVRDGCCPWLLQALFLQLCTVFAVCPCMETSLTSPAHTQRWQVPSHGAVSPVSYPGSVLLFCCCFVPSSCRDRRELAPVLAGDACWMVPERKYLRILSGGRFSYLP